MRFYESNLYYSKKHSQMLIKKAKHYKKKFQMRTKN